MISPEKLITLVAEVSRRQVLESGATHPGDVARVLSDVANALAEAFDIMEKEKNG